MWPHMRMTASFLQGHFSLWVLKCVGKSRELLGDTAVPSVCPQSRQEAEPPAHGAPWLRTRQLLSVLCPKVSPRCSGSSPSSPAAGAGGKQCQRTIKEPGTCWAGHLLGRLCRLSQLHTHPVTAPWLCSTWLRSRAQRLTAKARKWGTDDWPQGPR